MKRIYSLILSCGFAIFLHSQPINKYINDVLQPSPNEASLGKYLDIPVSHYTGVPNVQIPIHQLQQGPLQHSVYLSYHAGGVKAEELSSRVGLGWSLMAGGSVTRIVNGRRDDDNSTGARGYYHYGNLLTGSNPDLLEIVEGTRDGEPDLFSFKCGNYSGQFYINKNKEAILVPVQDIKVEVVISTHNYFDGFVITTPEGNRHYFGIYNGATAFDKTYMDGSTFYLSTWHLLRSETYDGLHHISYSYEDDIYSYTTSSSCRYVSAVCNNGGSTAMYCSSTAEFVFGQAKFAYRSTDVVGKRLQTITTDDESITFVSNTDREDLGDSNQGTANKKALDEIQITTGTFCKKYVLYNDFFSDPSHDDIPAAEPASKRLKLVSVTEKSCNDSIVKPPYLLTYNESINLQWRHTKQIDHWGYFNGAINNDYERVNISPSVVNSTALGRSNRSTSEAHAQAASLISITYPTGGSTSFEFESNRYTTDIIASEVLIDTTNCITPTQACCAYPDSIQFDRSFTAQELASPKIRLWLTVLAEGGYCDTTLNTASIQLTIYKGFSYVKHESFSINVNTAPYYDDHIYDQNSLLLNQLEADTLYTFILEITNGWGRMEFFSETMERGDELVGGLRIAQSTTYDGIDHNIDIIKTYTYLDENEDESSGFLLYKPIYGKYLNGFEYPLVMGQLATTFVTIFSTASFVPMSSYENNHIGYERVTEHHDGNGRIVRNFSVDLPSSSYPTFHPVPPLPYRASNGTEEFQFIHLEGDSTSVASYEYERDEHTFFEQSVGEMIRSSEKFTCASNPENNGFFMVEDFVMPTEVYLLGQSTFTLDSVSVITAQNFDSTERFVALASSSMTNSDGQKYHTEYSYPHDVSGAVYDSLVSLNIIQPVQTLQKVGPDISTATVIDGTSTLYDFFSTANGSYPYPEFIQRREVTWDDHSTYSDGGDVTQATMIAYDSNTGQPSSVELRGWETTSYTWNSNGTRASEDYEGYTKSYEYYPNTKLLSKVTQVDGTEIEHGYDSLMRPSSFTDHKGVTTSLEYNYGTGQSQNSIVTTTNYPTLGDDKVDFDVVKANFVDGIGRNIQQLAYHQHPDSTSLSIATDVLYNQHNQLIHQYEPVASDPASPDEYIPALVVDTTLNTFELSPLHRPQSTRPPQWYSSTSGYGANTANEVLDHQTGMYYPAKSLFKKSYINPDSQVVEVFIDKRNRTILSRAKANPTTTDTSEIADTYTIYDDKDRPIITLPPQTDTLEYDLILKKFYSGDDLIIKSDDPDAEPMAMIYDDRDLLLYRQDGNRKVEGRWYAYEYDDYGQLIQEGFAPDSSSAISEILISNTWGNSGIEKGKVTQSVTSVLNDPYSNTITETFAYDEFGRLIVTTSNSILYPQTGSTIDSLVLDHADNVIEAYQIINPDSLTIKQSYTFDHAGRRKKSRIQVATQDSIFPTQELSEYSYTVKEQILYLDLGEGLQNVEYKYLPNRFLRAINSSYDAHFPAGNDLFAINIGYDKSIDIHITGEEFKKNGDISSIQWRTKLPNGTSSNKQAYRFKYDFLNRLTEAYHFVSSGTEPDNQYTTSYSYKDHRGNFSTLSRKSLGTVIDDLEYSYYPGTNRILATSPAGGAFTGSHQLKSSTMDDFLYDDNGSITYDPNRATNIFLSHLNLPYKIDIPDSSGMVMYYYSADGRLLRQEEIRDSTAIRIRDYIGMTEFINGSIEQVRHDNGYIILDRGVPEEHLILTGTTTTDTTYTSLSIVSSQIIPSPRQTEYKAEKMIILTSGFDLDTGTNFLVTIDTFSVIGLKYRYFIKDHLGSVRMEFEDDGNGTAVQKSQHHFYPFGKEMTGSWIQDQDTRNNYQFTGQESQKSFDLGYQRFGARFYDPSIGRFTSVDPHADSYTSISPYVYVANNPLLYIDPDGMDIILGGGRDDKGDRFRNEIFTALQSLTDDKLELDGNKVIISERADGGDKASGTDLIRGFVEGFEIDGETVNRNVEFENESGNEDLNEALDSQAFTFAKNNTNARDPKKGTSSEILISPDVQAKFTNESGEREVAPFNIVVGHELIHADNNARGKRASLRPLGQGKSSLEERNVQARENVLRKEQKRKPRKIK